MRVTTEKAFKEVTIVLETQDEVDLLYSFANMADGDNKYRTITWSLFNKLDNYKNKKPRDIINKPIVLLNP